MNEPGSIQKVERREQIAIVLRSKGRYIGCLLEQETEDE